MRLDLRSCDDRFEIGLEDFFDAVDAGKADQAIDDQFALGSVRP